MKCFKRILSLVLVITLCAIPMNANATEKNVTSSMKKNKFVKKLVRDIHQIRNVWLFEELNLFPKTEMAY